MTTRKHTLTASLIALFAATPAIAQQAQTDQTQQQTRQQTETAQGQDAGRAMPKSATPRGQGTSDLANVETPQGTISADEDARQGRAVMLDVEGFSDAIYERGFRRGYMRGVADARNQFADEMERIRGERDSGTNRQSRMDDGTGTQSAPTPGQAQSEGTQAARQHTGESDARQAQGGDQQMAVRSGDDDRGAVIVLPPGVTPEMFVEQLMRANEGTMRGG